MSVPVGCRDTHGGILARKLGEPVKRLHCCPIGVLAAKGGFGNLRPLSAGVALRPPLLYGWGRNREQIPPWPFGRERFTAVPTGIDGCWPAILIPLGCSSGTNLTCPQVAKSPILRSEPF